MDSNNHPPSEEELSDLRTTVQLVIMISDPMFELKPIVHQIRRIFREALAAAHNRSTEWARDVYRYEGYKAVYITRDIGMPAFRRLSPSAKVERVVDYMNRQGLFSSKFKEE